MTHELCFMACLTYKNLPCLVFLAGSFSVKVTYVRIAHCGVMVISRRTLVLELLSKCQSVSQPVRPSVLALSPCGTHDQILAVVKTVAICLFWGVLPVERTGLSCDRSHTLFVLSSIHICTLWMFIDIFVLIFLILLSSSPRLHILRSLSTKYSRLCL